MKTRLLSLLLLVVMVMTAVPLVALTVFATEEATEYTAEDYNALYVQTNLLFAVDFFSTNKYWGETAASTTLKDAGYDWKVTGSYYLYGTAKPADGKITFGGTSGWSASINGWPTTKFTSSVTQEFVGIFRASASPLFNVLGVSVNATNASTYLDITAILASGEVLTTNGGERLNSPIATKLTGSASSVSTTAFLLTKSSTTSLEDGYFGGFLNGVAKYESNTVKYPAITNTDPALGVSVTTGTRDLYASRIYTRLLSETELAQNRFADLAKWFKIDLSYFNILDADAKAALYANAALYTIRFEAEDGKDQVEALVKAAAEAMYEGTVDSDILAVLVKYNLDAAPLVALPKGMLAGTMAYLAGLTDASENVAEGYEAALRADIVALLPGSDTLIDSYNTLYVQDGLYFAADFFATNSTWGAAVAETLNDYAWVKSDDVKFSNGGAVTMDAVSGGKLSLQNAADGKYLWVTGTGGKFTETKAVTEELVGIPLGHTSTAAFGLCGFYMTASGTSTSKYSYFRYGTGSDYVKNAAGTANIEYSWTVASGIDTYAISLTKGEGTSGTFRFLAAGKSRYNNTVTLPSGASFGNTALFHGWSTMSNQYDIYALRFYDSVLTTEQLAQNRFADLVKYLKLNVAGLDSLSDTARAAVYADVTSEVTFTTDRVDAQKAVSVAIQKQLRLVYEGLKEEGNTEKNAFLDLAYNYSLDIADVLATGRDMSSVYETVTEEALLAAGADKAQEILDEAYFDAWNYLSYCRDGEDAWNAQMLWCAENCSEDAYVDLEALMALPFAARLGTLGNVPTTSFEDAQAYIDEYVAEKMADYAVTPATKEQYNALYVQDGLMFAVDFFATNSYWGETATGASLADKGYDWKVTGSHTLYGTATPADGKITFGGSSGWAASINAWPTTKFTSSVTQEFVGIFRATADPLFSVLGVNVRATNASTYLDIVSITASGNLLTTNGGERLNSPIGTKLGASSSYASTTAFVLTKSSTTSLEDGYFGGYVNGVNKYESNTVKYPAITNADPVIGASVASGTRDLYASRIYTRKLSSTELNQNRFADLAKWFRLDLAFFDLMSAADKAALYADPALYTIRFEDENGKTALTNLVLSHVSMYKNAELVDDAEQNAAFLEVAELAALDVSRIANLLPDSREEFVLAFLAENDPAYAMNAAVVAKAYDDATYVYGALTFAGYQVRIDSGVASHNYAGVRAVFDINDAVIEKIVKTGKQVMLQVGIFDPENPDVPGAVIAFVYGWDADNEQVTCLANVMVVAGTQGEALTYDRVTAGGDTVTSFNYTVVYQGEDATAENYNKEFLYQYAITIGEGFDPEEGLENETTSVFQVQSETFGDTVSAAEVYTVFAGMEKYENDAVVKSVMDAITPVAPPEAE